MEENKKDKLNDKEKKLNKVLDIVKWVCVGVASVALVLACVFSCAKKQSVEDVSNANSVVLNANVLPKRAYNVDNAVYSCLDYGYVINNYRNGPEGREGVINDNFSAQTFRPSAWVERPDYASYIDERYVCMNYYSFAQNYNSVDNYDFNCFILTYMKGFSNFSGGMYVYVCFVDVVTWQRTWIDCTNNYLNSAGVSSIPSNSTMRSYPLKYLTDDYYCELYFACDTIPSVYQGSPVFTIDLIVGAYRGSIVDGPANLYGWSSSRSPVQYRVDGSAFDVAYEDGYRKGTEDRTAWGNERYNQGLEDAEANSVPKIIMMIFNAPYMILGGFLDFEIFGINFKNLVFFVISIGIVIWIVSVFKTKGN